MSNMFALFNQTLPEKWLFRITECRDGQSIITVYDPGSKLFNVSIGQITSREEVEHHLRKLVEGVKERAALERRVAERGATTSDMTVGARWYKDGVAVRVFSVDSDSGVVQYKQDPNAGQSSWLMDGPMLETKDVSNWTLY